MTFQFFLNGLEVEEPQGFRDIVFKITRDRAWHGVFFEASTSELRFYGNGADYLRQIKKAQGLKADVVFMANGSCGVYEPLEELITGRLNFGQYDEGCGDECYVSVPVEQVGCIMVMRNRYDQKVDMDSNVAFDKLVAVERYGKLGFTLDLPAKALEVSVEGTVEDAGEIRNFNANISPTTVLMFRPFYENEINNSIATGELIPSSGEGWINVDNGSTLIDISPQLLFEDTLRCYNGQLSYVFRLKGSAHVDETSPITTIDAVKLKVVRWNANGNLYDNGIVVEEVILDSNFDLDDAAYDVTFDHTFTGTITPLSGEGLYAFLELKFSIFPLAHINIDFTFDKESSVDISAIKSCPPTDTRAYMVHEALSHIIESITDQCFVAKSDYYGRTDSEPFAYGSDGCGALRAITNGLMVRRAKDAKFFLSLKDLFEGLRAIDNIGMGIEGDVLRVEPVEHFYQNEEIIALPFVPQANIKINESEHYSIIKSGYDKWETENVAGLDEVNSPREYRTSLSSINNTLDIQSHLVAGSYPIELTRQQNFADTGAADTKYDNETFIMCLRRWAYGFQIEQGNIDNAAGFFDPPTVYNWRIRPYYNLMRWFKSIASSYANVVDTDNKLFFSAGKGNYLASGQLNNTLYDNCKLENGPKAENSDMSVADFIDPMGDATPIWRPELATLTYPLSLRDYKAIKAKPYGYISFQCGTGEWLKGFIQEGSYALVKGEVRFTLKLKWS